MDGRDSGSVTWPCNATSSRLSAPRRSCGRFRGAIAGSASSRSPSEVGLPKGTVHGLLRTLQQVGFVEQDSDSSKYQLGPALLHMGSSYLDGNELRTRALNWSDSLAARTNEAVRIGTLHEHQVLIVHHVFRPDNSLQTLDVGSLLPLHATALGKVLLAHHPFVAAELSKSELPAYTDATITDPQRLERELERVRAQGWAADLGELVARPGHARSPDLRSARGDRRRDGHLRAARASDVRPPAQQ